MKRLAGCLAATMFWIVVPGSAAPPPRQTPDPMWAVIAATRQQGYDEGYLDGKQAASSLWRQCDGILRSVETKAKKASEYEECLRGVKVARNIGPYAVDAAIDACISKMPFLSQ